MTKLKLKTTSEHKNSMISRAVGLGVLGKHEIIQQIYSFQNIWRMSETMMVLTRPKLIYQLNAMFYWAERQEMWRLLLSVIFCKFPRSFSELFSY